jgi:hypothetical protein
MPSEHEREAGKREHGGEDLANVQVAIAED